MHFERLVANESNIGTTLFRRLPENVHLMTDLVHEQRSFRE